MKHSLEKGKGSFSLQTTIGGGLLSWSGVYFARWKLQAPCFVSFVRLLYRTYHHICSVQLFFPFEKRAMFLSKSEFSRKESTFGVVSSLWSPLKKPSSHQQFDSDKIFQPCYKQGLGRKMTRVVFHCKPQLGLVIFHWVDYILQVGSLALLFCFKFEIAMGC